MIYCSNKDVAEMNTNEMKLILQTFISFGTCLKITFRNYYSPGNKI